MMASRIKPQSMAATWEDSHWQCPASVTGRITKKKHSGFISQNGISKLVVCNPLFNLH
jgi:hypothetical protein